MRRKMLWIVFALAAIAMVTVPAAACDECGCGECGCASGCWFTAGGHITNLKGVVADFKGSYGGNGMDMKDGSIRGEWNHVDHLTGDHFHGIVSFLTCNHVDPFEGPDVPRADPNHVVFGGTGTLNGDRGYTFRAELYDIHEGGIHRDGYVITVKNSGGTVVLYNQATSDQCDPSGSNPIGCLAGGNIQIHPPNGGHPV